MRRRAKKMRATTTVPADGAEYLTPKAVLARWNRAVTMGTLRNWRWNGRGPAWTRIGSKVIYPIATLIEWERLHTVKSDTP
jgi:hypothetical protein